MLGSKSINIAGFVSLAAGVLLVLAGFVASHFISAGFLAIPVVGLLAVCVGILVAVFGANLIWPSRVNGFLDLVSRLGKKLESRRFYLSFCFACFFVALAIGLLLTQSGSGISPDSRRDILTAENIYHGYGFLDSAGRPYIHYPLYPLLIAGFMHLGFDGEQAASLIPILSFALLMFPLFFLGKTTNDVFTGYLACVVCLVFTPVLYVFSWAWHHGPYILFSVVAILFLARFAAGSEAKTKILCLSAFFTAVAILECYGGVVVLLVGLIVIIVKNKSRLRRGISQVLLFGSISCLPVIVWLYRNMTVASKVSVGSWREGGQLDALRHTVERIVRDVPNEFYRPLVDLCGLSGLGFCDYIGPAIIATCFTLTALYLICYSRHRKILLRYLERNYVVILYIFSGFLTLLTLFSLRAGYIESRYLSMVYPFIILIVISFIFYGYRQIGRPSLKPTLFSAVTIFCVLLFAFQAINSVTFYHTAKDGQGWNEAVFRNSQAISWVESNVPDDATLYSDRPYVMEFTIGRPTHFLPYSVAYEGSEEATDEWFGNLKEGENVFIIRFKGSGASSRYISNSKIAELNENYDVLEVIADFPEATIWAVR